jgi:peptidoglycan L-alanyl-D-glutamate endopeptidase CwlK
MYKFSKRSLDNLVGVHPELQEIVHDVMSLQAMDFSVVEGLRTKARQKELFDRGASKTMRSKHIKQSDGYAHAVDLYPYPIDMKRVNKGDAKEIARFGVLNGLVQAMAVVRGVQIINGMDWDGDGETLDHGFFDAPHYQIMGVL